LSPTESEQAFIARQPILDRNQSIVAYELLFRSANTQKMEILDDMSATSQVLLNTINSIGINHVLGEHLGFVNMHEQFFEEGIHESLDKNRFVLEILEHTKITPELVSKLASIAKDGYTLALDDFIFDDDMIETFRPVMPYIKIVKVDIMATNMNTLGNKLELFKGFDLELLAEKVETQKDFEVCKILGFHYFQGFFFSRPEIMKGKKIDPNVMAVMELIRCAQKPDHIKELEQAFKRHPEMIVNFLQFVNSTGSTFRSNITSVRHALNLVGQKKLLRWLMLMIYAKSSSDKKTSPLLATASLRASMMENLTIALGKDNDHELNQAYLTGILSLMDAVFQVEMEQLLKDLAIDKDISQAILKREGLYGQLLELTISCERQEFEMVSKILENLKLNRNRLGDILTQSYSKAEIEI
jgi:EAL and modified HD-GYP domain-containing signal transduction protein